MVLVESVEGLKLIEPPNRGVLRNGCGVCDCGAMRKRVNLLFSTDKE